MDLYILSSIHLHGVELNELSTGTSLPYEMIVMLSSGIISILQPLYCCMGGLTIKYRD
jgi:hypothetical protein